jgi:hypothetical protein
MTSEYHFKLTNFVSKLSTACYDGFISVLSKNCGL